jgi:hypothetical protein
MMVSIGIVSLIDKEFPEFQVWVIGKVSDVIFVLGMDNEKQTLKRKSKKNTIEFVIQ